MELQCSLWPPLKSSGRQKGWGVASAGLGAGSGSARSPAHRCVPGHLPWLHLERPGEPQRSANGMEELSLKAVQET